MSNGIGNNFINTFGVKGNILYAGTSNGIYNSTNFGTNWIQSNLNNHCVMCLLINGNYIVAGTLTEGIFISSNNGINWSLSLNVHNRWVRALVIHQNNMYAGFGDSGVYVSTNNGINWSQTSLNHISVLSLLSIGNNIFAGTNGYGVYISTNNGSNWVQKGINGESVFALDTLGNNIFTGTFAAYPFGKVYKSTNLGTNWIQTSYNDKAVSALVSLDNNLFAGTQRHGVFLSKNNGTSWIKKNEGFNSDTIIVNTLLMTDNYIFAGTEGFSVWRRSYSEIISGVEKTSGIICEHIALNQNYPNPFNPSTKIRYDLPKNGFVKLIVFDALGREIETLVNEKQTAGTYEVTFNASQYPSGVYFYRLTTDNFSGTKKMLLIK